jgi:hypothetical protein
LGSVKKRRKTIYTAEQARQLGYRYITAPTDPSVSLHHTDTGEVLFWLTNTSPWVVKMKRGYVGLGRLRWFNGTALG